MCFVTSLAVKTLTSQHSGGDSLATCSDCELLSPSEGNLTLDCSSCPNQFGNYGPSSVNLGKSFRLMGVGTTLTVSQTNA